MVRVNFVFFKMYFWLFLKFKILLRLFKKFEKFHHSLLPTIVPPFIYCHHQPPPLLFPSSSPCFSFVIPLYLSLFPSFSFSPPTISPLFSCTGPTWHNQRRGEKGGKRERERMEKRGEGKAGVREEGREKEKI